MGGEMIRRLVFKLFKEKAYLKLINQFVDKARSEFDYLNIEVDLEGKNHQLSGIHVSNGFQGNTVEAKRNAARRFRTLIDLELNDECNKNAYPLPSVYVYGNPDRSKVTMGVNGDGI